jgi:glyoxylase-like metal-dependent hydrolase (beta-lactamase superfamily II)
MKRIVQEVSKQIFCIPLPMDDNPLRYINAYLIKTSKGCILIDFGWNSDNAFTALKNGLREVDTSFSDIRYFLPSTRQRPPLKSHKG